MKKIFFHGGVILSLSAIASKFLGLLRDRLLIQYFDPSETDLVFSAFRVPDFFFYMLVGATLSIIIIPRLENLSEKEKENYISSFFWGIFFFFGTICLVGFWGSESLIEFYTPNLSNLAQKQAAGLTSLLFVSVFLLGLSSLFAAYFQHKDKIFSLALGPLIYTASLVLGLFIFQDTWGIKILGYSAILGASFNFLINIFYFYWTGQKISWCWKKPVAAWKNFRGDFLRRVLGNSAYQINQSLDIFIANLLAVGSATAFSMGSNLGHVLLSLIGIPIANIIFPKLSRETNNLKKQKQILKKSLQWILFWTIPFVFVSLFVSRWLLNLIYTLDSNLLEMADLVFLPTVLSLPAVCMIPVLSRFFLANQDTHTPLYITLFSMSFATVVAAFFSLKFLPPQTAILGLGIGNFVSNYLLMGLLFYFVFRKKIK